MSGLPKRASFIAGGNDRAKESFAGAWEVTCFKPSRLSSKGATSVRMLVLTEKAVYEFKGTSTKGKENNRYKLSEISVVLASLDTPTRFLFGFSDNSTRTYETSTRETREVLVSALKGATAKAGLVTVFAELDDRHIDRVLGKLKRTGSSTKNAWTDTLKSTANGAAGHEPGSANREPGSADRSGGGGPRSGISRPASLSSGESVDDEARSRVGTLGGLGPMTLIWRRVEHASNQVSAQQEEGIHQINAKLQANLGTDQSVFTALGAPRDGQHAMIALSSVMLDAQTSLSLAKILGPAKGSAFFGALEANLGCGDEVIRRWTGVSLMFSLPFFASEGCIPSTPVWQQAAMEYATQVKRKENAALKILFQGNVDAQHTGAADASSVARRSSGLEGGGGALDKKNSSLNQQQQQNNKPQDGEEGGAPVLTTQTSGRSLVASGAKFNSRPPNLKFFGGRNAVASTQNPASAASAPPAAATPPTASSSITEKKPSNLNLDKKAPSNLAEPRRPSMFPLMFGGDDGGGGGGDANSGEQYDRRLRGAVSLMWISRLLDLESAVLADEDGKDVGIRKNDVQALLQVLLGRYPNPNGGDESTLSTVFEVETFGASVEFPEFFPSLMSCLAATRFDDVRCVGLKQVNVLVMRNNNALRAFLGVPDWQSIILPCLYNVPFEQSQRSEAQEDVYSYSMHLLTTLHMCVLGSRSECTDFGPIDKLLGQTIFKIAIFGGWGDCAIAVSRSLLKGIFSSLSKQAASATCSWRFSPSMDEWEELFRLSHLLQTFLFFRPVTMALNDAPALIAEATLKASKHTSTTNMTAAAAASSGAVYSDWRAHIKHDPLLKRAANERMVAAHRQMYSRLGLPVMTATHRGDETGIHLDEFGQCADRALVETAIRLWTACGITGILKQDEKKSLEYTTKSDRSRIMYASNVCRELRDVLTLFDNVDAKRKQLLTPATSASGAGAPKKKAGAADSSSKRASVTKEKPPAQPQSSSGEAQAVFAADANNTRLSTAQIDQVKSMARSKATDYLEKQKKKDTNVGFLSRAKTKTPAVDLRSNMLQKREVAVRKLGSGSDKVQAQLAASSTAAQSSGRRQSREETGNHKDSNATTKLLIRGTDVMSSGAQQLEDEKSVFEMAQRGSGDDTAARKSGLAGRKTLVKLNRGTVAAGSTGTRPPGLSVTVDSTTISKSPSPKGDGMQQARGTIAPSPKGGGAPPRLTVIGGPGSGSGSGNAAGKNGSGVVEMGTNNNKLSNEVNRKRVRAPMCHGCDLPIEDEIEEVSKFGHFWHSECVVCSNCLRNVLATGTEEDKVKGKAALDTCLYFPVSHLLLCSTQCRDEVLKREGDARCPGCMDGFNKGEKTLFAIGFNWHVDSNCFRCNACDLSFNDSVPYFEYQGHAYCGKCLEERFMTCKTCTKPLLPTDKVVMDAQGSQYHDACFVCSVCKEPFAADGSFYTGTQGELLCFTHFLGKRSPPCAACHLPLNRKKQNETQVEDPLAIAGLTFHRSCFKCSKCNRALSPNAKPGSDDEPNEHVGSLFCPDCYAEEYGLRCKACGKGIRGDVLHAGVGNKGETINWHPACFSCDECACSLVEVQFFLVTVGDDLLVPCCFDHYLSRYGNRQCPGCHSVVVPTRSRMASEAADDGPSEAPTDLRSVNGRKEPNSASSVSGSVSRGTSESVVSMRTKETDRNPAIMYDEKMWHARCLVCDEPDCNVSLYEDQGGILNKFRVDVVAGKKYCSAHYEQHLDTCQQCKKPLYEPGVDIMDWKFHVECFCCVNCNEPIKPGQALKKVEDVGPAHVTCEGGKGETGGESPSRRKTGFGRLFGR